MTGERVRTGERNRRATIYPYAPTVDAGYAEARYGAARGTHWCRFDPVMGSESETAGQADHTQSATLDFRDAVTVLEDDLIVVDGRQWRVTGIIHDRQRRSKIATVIRSTDAATLPTG